MASTIFHSTDISLLVCLHLMNFNVTISGPVTLVNTFVPSVGNISRTDRYSISPRSPKLGIRNDFALPNSHTPSISLQNAENLSVFGLRDTSKTRIFGDHGGADAFSLTAPDPKYDANVNERLQNGLSLLDSIKSLVGMMVDSGEIEVDVWKFENGESSNGFVPDDLDALESDKCYVFTKTDAAAAASHAIQLDSEIHSRINIRREVQGRESVAFKALFKQVEFQPISNEGTSEKLNDMYVNRMFLISEAGNELDFKEADLTLSLHYAYNNRHHCLIFVSTNIFVSCGMATSESQRQAAAELAESIMKKSGFMEIITVYRNQNALELPQAEKKKLLLLFAELHRLPETTAKNQPLEIYQLHEDPSIFQEANKSRSISLRTLNLNSCYILDSCSNAGVYVWMSKISDVKMRMESAREAELFLKKRGYDYSTPITYIDFQDISFSALSVQGSLFLVIPKNGDEDDFPAEESVL